MAQTSAPPAVAPDRKALARLDDAVVPRLQAGARTSAHLAAAPLRGIARAEDAVAGGPVRWAVRHSRALLLVATVLAVVGSSVHFQRYPEIQQAEADRRAAAAEQTVSRPGRTEGATDGELAGGAQVVGPPVGTPVDDYIEDRHAELAGLTADGRRLAVVSFGSYVTAAEALEVLPEGTRIHAAQLRIPAADEDPFQTEVVENDLLGSVERALSAPMAAFAEEEAALAELIPSVTDPAFKAAYEQDLEELRAIRNLVNSGAGTLFALVVQAEVGDLQALVDAGPVRLIDVAPGETDAATSGFFGLVPEDVDRVTHGIEV